MVQSSSDHSVDSDRKKETREERLLRKAKAYVEREERRKRKKRKRKDEHAEQKRTKSHSKKNRDHDERNQEDERISDTKRSRRDVDDKRRRKKHKKRSKESSKERKSGRKASYNLKPKTKIEDSALYNLGIARGRPPAQLLDAEKDYFAYHQHLWLYLHRKEGVAFGDLSSSEARDAFCRFVKRYNAGSLETAYYESILPSEAMENSLTTRHQWNFQTNDTEKNNLHLIEEGVRKQTDYQKVDVDPVEKGERECGKDKPVPDSFPSSYSSNSRTGKRPEERLAEKIANRRLREHAKVAEEEWSGGRKEGHERQLEKRKESAAVIHGAARDREEIRVGIELQDSDIYGGDSNDFAAALQRERQRKLQRGQRKDDRVKELQQKERDRQEAMLKSLGLSGIRPGQKIKIRPRDDS